MKQCKHKFQPRYDEVWSTYFLDAAEHGQEFKVKYEGGATLKPYMKKKTYICDICVKCGATVKNET